MLHDELPNWSKVRKPQASSWLDIQWPVVGAHFTASFTKNQRLRVEVYIDLGDGEKNLELFERLRSRRDIIEGAFGSALEWEDLPGRKACRIGFYGAGDVLEEDKHDQYVTWFVTNLARLREAFPPAVFATGVGGLSDTSPKVATRLE